MSFLEYNNVSVSYSGSNVVDNVNFTLEKGNAIGIAGASGCGKSTLAKACLGILPSTAKLSGSIKYKDNEIVGITEHEYEKLRGDEISMVFQDPTLALNPIRKIKYQFYDIFDTPLMKRKSADKQILHFLNHVHIINPEKIMEQYPNQLSGGMKQRIVIAMSISKNPELLIADEPTSALDASVRLQIIDEILSLKERLGFGMIYISHNIAELAKVSNSIMVMKNGVVVEHKKTDELLSKPNHPYTKELLSAAKVSYCNT